MNVVNDVLGFGPDLTLLLQGLQAGAPWLAAVMVVAASGWAAGWMWWRRRAALALRGRTAVDLVPTAGFDPSVEAVERHAAHLARVPAAAGWVPRRAGAVRVRALCVDQELVYRLEGPAQAAAVLRLATYAHVDVVDTHVVRARTGNRIRFEGAPPNPRPGLEFPGGERDETAEQDEKGTP
ncbi:hypothetical protein GCM10010329_81170 [Streptomyces spiroverticillatus]|uniref:Uncharacterized protein n=1 Tax=Streptomyces finlayi TaxID=67296 RepID=A0A918X818_9ACTN|nr:hypothetical protein [Streptomyces finlayi]GHA46376.1 hypothetical protein GCM10010329_81170 [Streptomyces spiroverticillatus]GHD16328.1 hypothetical protein GCM10010334_77330 [Streptomyces finlayi]